jgi:nucleoside-diphosphate-sugar epimerase
MRVLITGGTGYVGSYLCRELLRKGHEPILITRRPVELDQITSYTFSGEIDDLKRIFNESSPTHVIHLAADVSKNTDSRNIGSMLEANIILPALLLQLSAEYKIQRFINISTFSTSVDGCTYSPQTYYAATKKAVEDLVAFYSLRTDLSLITLCFYDIYGPAQPHARFLNAVIEAIREKKELHMSPGEQEICFLSVHDAVDSMIYALGLPLPSHQIHTSCVYGTEVFQLKKVPGQVAEILGLGSPPIVHDVPYREVEIMKFSPPHPLLKGWGARVSFFDGIKEIFGRNNNNTNGYLKGAE